MARAADLPLGVTAGRWLRTWLAQRVQLRPSTRRMYESHIRNYLQPALGGIPLSELTPEHVRRLVARIADDHERKTQALKPATVVRILATLRAALNAAVREGLLVRNPVALVELPPRQRPHPRVWTQARVAAWQATGTRPVVAVWTTEQTARFLTAACDHPLYPLLHLIAVRGLRRGEAAGLTWPAIAWKGAP